MYDCLITVYKPSYIYHKSWLNTFTKISQVLQRKLLSKKTEKLYKLKQPHPKPTAVSINKGFKKYAL